MRRRRTDVERIAEKFKVGDTLVGSNGAQGFAYFIVVHPQKHDVLYSLLKLNQKYNGSESQSELFSTRMVLSEATIFGF